MVLAVTGGGVAAITDLLRVPGASRTVLEVLVPYAETSLVALLGEPPSQATSEATARSMALACRRRAQALASDRQPVAGVACTAALVTDRPKRGDHRAHIAVAASGEERDLTTWFVGLDKGDLDRVGEDRAVADVVLRAIAAACGLVDEAS